MSDGTPAEEANPRLDSAGTHTNRPPRNNVRIDFNSIIDAKNRKSAVRIIPEMSEAHAKAASISLKKFIVLLTV